MLQGLINPSRGQGPMLEYPRVNLWVSVFPPSLEGAQSDWMLAENIRAQTVNNVSK